MVSWPILSVTTFLPLAGALWIMLTYSDGAAEHRNARRLTESLEKSGVEHCNALASRFLS